MKLIQKRKNRIFAFLGLVAMIAISFFLCFLGGGGTKKGEGYTSANTPTSIGSLTLSDYDTRTDGAVFDQAVLQKLYAKLVSPTGTSNTYASAYNAVNTSSSTLYAPANGQANYPWTESKSKNFVQINGTNGANAFSVQFGGFAWNVVYATTNTTAGSNDLVVTLWMSDVARNGTTAITSQWNTYSNDNTSNAYPCTMYSTSKIRMETLNAGDPNGGETYYATSNTLLGRTVTQAARKSNIFAPFTLSKSVTNKSLTRFLVSPNKVAYQEKESFVWSYAGSYPIYLIPNEAWGSPDETLLHYSTIAANCTGGWSTNGNNTTDRNMTQTIAKQEYKDWTNDTLWLPSMTETGYRLTSDFTNYGTSLWGIPHGNAVRNSSDANWLRSAHQGRADSAHYLVTDGGVVRDSVTTTLGVRPALHLNLTEAALHAAGESLDNPTDVTTTYDGTAQNVKTLYSSQNWYHATWYEHTGNYVAVACYASSDASLSTPLTTVTNAGDYWVKVDLANWVAAVNTQVSNEFSGTNVSSFRISSAQAIRKPRFKGTASSDGTHTESDTVRWFKITVNRAEVDFSHVVWSANELEFNGDPQQVTIISGFPSFLTPSYTHPSPSTNIDTYTTRVSGVTPSDSEMAKNYNVPTSAQLLSIRILNHEWKIVRKRITISWKMPGQETSAGSGINVPIVQGDTLGAVETFYYAADRTTIKTLAEIESEYNPTTQTNYYAFARLKGAGASGTAYNATNCELYESATNVTATGSYFPFQTGGGKTGITVGISPDHVTYNGSAQPAGVTFTGGSLTIADFHVSYTMKDGTAIPAGKADASGVPIGAGEYRAKIELDSSFSGTYAITGPSEFDYTIEKAEFDLSGFKWVDESGAEYTAPYTWANGVSHTLHYDGTVADLSFAYTSDTSANLTGSNAGSYRVIVKFTNENPDNYEDPADEVFTWEIAPYVPDLSAVKWNYDNTYVYKMVDGAPAEYEVYLENLPAGLEDLIDYSGDTGVRTNADSYTTTFTIDESDPARQNYGALNFPSTVLSSLSWEIKSLTFEKPNLAQTETYRENGYTFSDIAGLPEGWEQYFDVTVVDSDENPIAPVDGGWTLINVDSYAILIRFKSGMNTSVSGTTDNVKWSDNDRGGCRVAFRITPLVFEVKGWLEQGGNIRPTLDVDRDVLREIEKYFDYVLINAETNETLAITATLEHETVYTIALKLKTGFEGNVLVEYMGTQGEETAPYPFMTDVDPLAPPPTSFYRKPTDEEAHVYYRYTGKEVAFKLGAWFVEEKMQILARAGSAESLLKGTEEGDYIVRVGFKKGARSAWEPASAVPADRAPVTITFTISKDAKLGDRFILKDGITVPFAFLYDDFSDVGAIEDYAFNADKLAYISRLSLGDTLSALLSQFENGADITVYDLDGTTVITDLETVVATGMYLRLMDGDTMLNQLILAVLGEITGDGIINLKDKAQLNSYTLGTTKLAPAQLLASDITGDGIINLKDKAQLNSYTLGTNALPVTPIPVPAPSSVSEVVENTEVVETPIFVSLSEVTEEVPARATSAKAVKAGFTTVTTDHRASTSQFAFAPDYAKKKYPK